jgi:bifunctional UDP-N-acetylglucosamine pyrophosphorylase/glucosamine-1-phosphate N-acetyltransferase
MRNAACRMCNSGLMAVRRKTCSRCSIAWSNDNAAGEYYLVDIVNIANVQDGRHCAVVTTDPL